MRCVISPDAEVAFQVHPKFNEVHSVAGPWPGSGPTGHYRALMMKCPSQVHTTRGHVDLCGFIHQSPLCGLPNAGLHSFSVPQHGAQLLLRADQ